MRGANQERVFKALGWGVETYVLWFELTQQRLSPAAAWYCPAFEDHFIAPQGDKMIFKGW